MSQMHRSGHRMQDSREKTGQYACQNPGKVDKVMHEFKAGTLHSGSKTGPKVTSRAQGIAIAMSEAGRKKGRR